MISDRSPRPDLVDRGLISPGRPEKVAASRRPLRYVTDGQSMETPAATEILVGLDGGTTDDQFESVAKIVASEGSMQYFVKVKSFGAEKGHLVNPRGIYFRREELKMAHGMTGRDSFVFVSARKGIFEDYVRFLRTQDSTFFQRAQRELLNA